MDFTWFHFGTAESAPCASATRWRSPRPPGFRLAGVHLKPGKMNEHEQKILKVLLRSTEIYWVYWVYWVVDLLWVFGFITPKIKCVWCVQDKCKPKNTPMLILYLRVSSDRILPQNNGFHIKHHNIGNREVSQNRGTSTPKSSKSWMTMTEYWNDYGDLGASHFKKPLNITLYNTSRTRKSCFLPSIDGPFSSIFHSYLR